MEYSDFFERIKKWVVENNTTIEALLAGATNKNISKFVYYGWQKRKNLPSGEYCYQLAQYMGVTTDWLISGKDSNEKLEKYSSLLNKLDLLDQKTLHSVIVQIEALAVEEQKK